jgi:hypothetical protein
LATVDIIHLMLQGIDFGLELLDAQSVFISDCIVILAGRAVSLTSLARALAITSDF